MFFLAPDRIPSSNRRLGCRPSELALALKSHCPRSLEYSCVSNTPLQQLCPPASLNGRSRIAVKFGYVGSADLTHLALAAPERKATNALPVPRTNPVSLARKMQGKELILDGFSGSWAVVGTRRPPTANKSGQRIIIEASRWVRLLKHASLL